MPVGPGPMYRIDFNKLRFLICDDNPHMRRILRTLLHSFGAREVYESEDGATALEMYTHYVPDIVITDWSMPTARVPSVIARGACDAAIHFSTCRAMDCFAALAMTGTEHQFAQQ